MRSLTLRWALVLLPLLAACSLSESISTSFNNTMESMSDSFNTMSESSSPGGADASAPYQQDIRAYTGVFLAQGGSAQDFTRGLSRIAADHGVTDWEAQAATMLAVGEGLADGHVSADEVERLCRSLTDARRAELVREGYRSALS